MWSCLKVDCEFSWTSNTMARSHWIRQIVGGEVSVVRLVDHLRHPNHVSRRVLSGIAISLLQSLCFKATASRDGFGF
jgi:hypothetical protein